MDLTLYTLQRLICHKTQQINQTRMSPETKETFSPYSPQQNKKYTDCRRASYFVDRFGKKMIGNISTKFLLHEQYIHRHPWTDYFIVPPYHNSSTWKFPLTLGSKPTDVKSAGHLTPGPSPFSV